MPRLNLAGLLARVGASGREALGGRLGGRWASREHRAEAPSGDGGPLPASPDDPEIGRAHV